MTEKKEHIIIYGKEAREALKKGIDRVANAVKVTLGAQGRNVLISNNRGYSPHITKDGVTVAKSIEVKDALERQGALLIKEVAETTNTAVGDGPQPYYTRIITPYGYKRIKDLKVGDSVCGTNGTVQTIEGVYDKGIREIYNVVFSDGRVVECCAEHLWTVFNSKGVKKTLPLKEIIKKGIFNTNKYGDKIYNFYTPKTKVFFNEQKVDLDPYLIGVLLGDGSLTGSGDIEISLGLNKEHIIDKLILPKGLYLKIKWVQSKNYFRIKIKGKTDGGKTIKELLFNIGLLKSKSFDKFIPSIYMFNSFENRIKLIQGLLDTGGHLNKRGLYEFSSVSLTMTKNFLDLMRSVGRTVRYYKQIRNNNSYSNNPIYRVSELKGYKYGDKIVDVVKQDIEVPTMCIKVSNDDSLYLNSNYIVTHNTTTSTVLAQKLCNDGLDIIEDGSINIMQFRKGMESAREEVSKIISSESVKITSKEDVKNIATISANNDAVIGNLISDAYEKIGKHGVISIDNSENTETYIEYVDGYQFDRGLITPYFITDGEKMRTVLENPFIIVTDYILNRADDFTNIMNEINKKGRSVLVICDDMEFACVQDFLRNHVNGFVKMAVVKAPEFGDRRYDMLQDICTVTGATFISKEKGDDISTITLDDLGEADSVKIDMDNTTIVGGQGAKELIQKRVDEIKSLMDGKKGYELEIYEKRLGKLTGGAAVIRIGAKSEVDLKELKDRVEDALNAVKASIEEGVLPGGGTFLYRIYKGFYDYGKNLSEKENYSFYQGYNLVINSLDEPIKTILRNGAVESSLNDFDVQLYKNSDLGVDVTTGEIVNMFEVGIIDPAKVIRSTVDNAVSVAGTLLLTEAIVLGEDYNQSTPRDLF